MHVRDPANPGNASKGLQATQVSAGDTHSLAVGSDGNAWAWGNNKYGELGDGSTQHRQVWLLCRCRSTWLLVVTGVRFDQQCRVRTDARRWQ
ncbi:hypothetical protein [Bifidobacterium asteroides]|uniref:hypothetical protein n=1 Tax=Bifidobacterium asteroides TaxID=1684 RepID=UPI002741FA2B|nr:hypothetical protein [Bifidobacterium asteroides]